MRLVSLERAEGRGAAGAEHGGESWILTLELADTVQAAEPVVQVSTTAVRVERDGGCVETFSLPAGCEPIDQACAKCKLYRRRKQVVIKWPVAEPAKPVHQATEKLPPSAVALAPPALDSPSRGQALPSAAPLIDYSRFDDIVEDDATLKPVEVESLHHRHCMLRRMRGEDPLDLFTWKRSRGRQAQGHELDPHGRGLWCRTNLEDVFEEEATTPEMPPDSELPKLPVPDLLSALSRAPGAQVVDATAWAKGALRAELVKACSTDRSQRGRNEDLKIDAIISSVDIGEGNAAVVMEGDRYLCAYRFKVRVSYCVNISQRPAAPGEQPAEGRFFGEIVIQELASGSTQEALPEIMSTSLGDPKPPKQQMVAVRPILVRLERSLAYFVRRFERRFLTRKLDTS